MNKHGNTGKQNAMKGDEPASSYLHIRVTRTQKASWVRCLNDSEKLSQFVINACNKEMRERVKK